MKNCLLFLIVTIVSTVYCGDNPADIPPQPPRPHPNSTTTTAKPTTLTPITTTLAPETTTPKTPPSPSPNSTTTAPTTTTPKPTPSPSPNSTTTAPTTTTLKPTSPPSPNSTTTAPTTTTLKPTTSKPTPSPTPIPNPIMGNWSVTDPKTKQSCILMDAALQIEIPNTKINKTTKINVPVKASSSGNCSTINQVIYLEWNSTILVNDSLKFEFSKLLNKSQFELLGIDFTMSAGQNVTSLHHRRAEFVTPLANSYKCNKLQTFNLTDDKNVTIAYLHVSHLQLQAYRNSTGQSFDSAKDCESSVTPDVVPIVVGCVLAVLVVAVLVAYLVGRRRCQARGYLSM